LKEFGVVKNMFKKHIKIKKLRKSNKSQLTRSKRKTKQKTQWSVLSCQQQWDVRRKEKRQKSKYT